MKRFTDYTVEDFASDPLFIKWVQHPDDYEISNFWTNYLQNNPTKALEVTQARELVSGISQTFTEMGNSEVRTLWRRVQQTIQIVPEVGYLDRTLSPLLSAPPVARWGILFFMLLAGWVIWQMM